MPRRHERDRDPLALNRRAVVTTTTNNYVQLRLVEPRAAVQSHTLAARRANGWC